jgi:proteasome accessory factor A
VPKLCGADIELGNYLAGQASPQGSGPEAARLMLAALARAGGGVGSTQGTPRCGSVQDWGRQFLAANGGSAYIDLDHLELCLPEVRSAYDHLAAWHAMLRLGQIALRAVNARRPADRPVRVLVNSSDGHGHSYGSHLNVLLARRTWEDIMERRLHYLAFLIAHQVSSLVLTGQGKVGSENGAPDARYQLSQRADFLETLLAPQTTYRRPVVNTRDEPHTGTSGVLATESVPATRALARLHVICYDSTLCHSASLLKPGLLQIVLAMLEAGAVPPLALDDPLGALQVWSRDPELRAQAGLVDGRRVTAVELQLLIHGYAVRFAAGGGCDDIVPRADDLLAHWGDTLDKCRERNWPALAPRLDWVLKLGMLERALHGDPRLDWDGPALKMLDHLYGSLDPGEGLYWAWARAGGVEELVAREDIARLAAEPPEDTRAWTRAMLLRRAGPAQVELVDWDHIRFRLRRTGRSPARVHLRMANPVGWTRDHVAPLLAKHHRLHALLAALGGMPIAATRSRPADTPRRRAGSATTGGPHD